MNDTAMTTTTPDNVGTLTSLAQLFDRTINGTQVKAIEIPLFQRDYAQGRMSEQAIHVRERFITNLCAALDSDQDIHLDFVFGDVVNGTLYPLDGQQRLTTLFLLHCYLSWHIPAIAAAPPPWHAFHYATRPGARAFCQFLTHCRPDTAKERLSEWLCDQAHYLPTWKHDPTIQGMMVMLDALHQHYRIQSIERRRTAWQRLTDPDKPAISFLLLPVAVQQLNNNLYVKMNSRGRPLTEFENFKAELEAQLRKNPSIASTAIDAFSRKIDTDWSDLFWQYRGGNNQIDEECMRYLRFLFEVLAWKRGIAVNMSHSNSKALSSLAELLLGRLAKHASDDFEWIVRALDIWLEDAGQGIRKPKAIRGLFSQLFIRESHNATIPLRIFNFRDFKDVSIGVDMLHACCALYGPRPWTLAHTLLLYGVIQGIMGETILPDLHPRLRLLRNLIEASSSEIRADNTRNNMQALLREVEILMAGGPLSELKTFNQVQVRNEQAKKALVAAHPVLQNALYRLEDHELLRGGLTVFDLDPEKDATIFANRAAQFSILFGCPYHLVSAALLTKGHQGRGYGRSSGHRLTYLGAPRRPQGGLWVDHWRVRYNERPHPSSAALMCLLDDMGSGLSPKCIVDTFLAGAITAKDWRYYLVKYEVMRGENLEFAGSYVLAPDRGYAICMLLSDSCDNRSNHHDAYLLALVDASALAPERIGNDGWPRCFPGYETEERHLMLRNSGIQIRCVDAGWQFSGVPDNALHLQAFEAIAKLYPTLHNQNLLYVVPQHDGIDTEDRIELASQLVRELVKAGL